MARSPATSVCGGAAHVTVMRSRYVKAWPNHPHGERVYVVELGRALSRRYSSDAHFTQYVAVGGRRLSRNAIGIHEGGISLHVLSFDFDCAAVHGTKEPAPDVWRKEQQERVRALACIHGSPFFYETRGGARLVYRVAPFVITSAEHAYEWSLKYAEAAAYLARRFELYADMACSDWQRLFRLPRATRDGVQPEARPTLGDPFAIPLFEFEPTAQDLLEARRNTKTANLRTELALPFFSGDGHGVLYHALRARRAIVRGRGDGAFEIRCPRERLHTSGRTGDGSTLLYPPAVGHQVGAIHCLHAHCARLGVRDWLAEFEAQELAEARRTAGLGRTG